MHAIPLQCTLYCVTEIVTPVWLSTSLDNCSELACRFLQPFSSEDAPDEVLTSRTTWTSCEMVADHLFKCLYHFATVF